MAQWSSGGDGGVAWRRALYGGVLGSAGVTLGWLLWFVMQTAVKVPKVVLLSPLVGAVVGVVYDFFRDYLAASQGEEDDGPEDQEPKIAEARLRPGFYEGSGVQRRDQQLFYGVLAVLAGAILYISCF